MVDVKYLRAVIKKIGVSSSYFQITICFIVVLQTTYQKGKDIDSYDDLSFLNIINTSSNLYNKEEIQTNVAENSHFKEDDKKKRIQPTSLKYILIWTRPAVHHPFVDYGMKQRQFIENNCSFINCYVTDNRDMFGGDITKFDVIAFNGRLLDSLKKSELPQARSPRQKYIYGNSESAQYFPIKHEYFDDYFNWTYTYRLDSDFIFPYFEIKNKNGEIVGPSNNMTWKEMQNASPSWFKFRQFYKEIMASYKSKRKAAAWFVTNCVALSYREDYVDSLNAALRKYNLKVDIYGWCGDLKCPRSMSGKCNNMLKKDYFFYLALENSFATDYVTEKVVTALNNDVVPVVWGAANYDKFLPPHSYINARLMKPKQLAKKMYSLMNNLPLYFQYFKWKQFYTYEESRYNVCSLCEAINDDTKFKVHSSYKEFRKWWNAAPVDESELLYK